jgi:hypothetical protein
MSKVFGSAARGAAMREQGAEDDIEVLTIETTDETRDVKFRYPGTGQMAYLALAMASDEGDLVQAGQLINFVANMIVDDEDVRFFRRSILEFDSGFELEDVQDLVEELLTRWGGDRPTQSSAASSPQRQATGKRSTGGARAKAAASSRSTSR